jgi:hypothetical protein
MTDGLEGSPSRNDKDESSSPTNLKSIQPALNLPNIMKKIEEDQIVS